MRVSNRCVRDAPYHCSAGISHKRPESRTHLPRWRQGIGNKGPPWATTGGYRHNMPGLEVSKPVGIHDLPPQRSSDGVKNVQNA